jgi:hypothetical protein
MNDKIIELALKSTLLNYIDNETPRRYFICGNADIEEVEKFAELIIKECHHVIKSDMELKHIQMVPINFQMYANNGLERVIKEHFGVEE